jgi:signal transduction histidine kinase/ActR/RegA family two-component response regulator
VDPLLDEAPCGFLVVGDDGAIVAANRTVARLLSSEPQALARAHVDRILDVPGRIFYQTHVFPTLKLQGVVHEVYMNLVDAEGASVPVMLNAVRRARDDRFVSDWAVVPMRQRNEYENEILKARKQAEEASRAKDQFLALVSHELRSPLSAISGWAHILSQDRVEEGIRKRGLAAIQANTRAQVKLVDDLLDYGRISTGKLRLDLAPVPLAALVASVLEGVMPTAQAKGVMLDGIVDGEGLFVSADGDRLRQVLWNILVNAVKFTPKNGRVTIRLRRDGSWVEVAVSDTGRGIAPEFLPVLFDRFRQENGGVRREGGLGLGMSIARHLVELHGGTISAASPGRERGSTFTLRLPLLVGHVPAAVTGRSDAPDLAGTDVLVVDDDQDAREWLQAVLSGAGARVRTVGTAADAVSHYMQRRPNVLVSDLEMAGGDGFALIRRVRELDDSAKVRTPAIALTGRAQAKDRIRAMSAGFHLHLPKPVDPLELLVAISNLARMAAD